MTTADRTAMVASVFDRSAPTYESVGVPWFVPIAERLVAELAPAPGERALDIGCGRGAALFPLADAVGPGGHVTGFDLSPAMIAKTRADVEERGLGNVDLHVTDAMAPQLPAGGYDVAAACLVIFFLPDPAAALRAWRELLAPTGRLAISTFGPREARWITLDDLFTPYLPPALLDARTSGTTGPFSSDAGVDELLRSAGYTGVRTAGFDVDAVFTDAEQWHAWSWSHGQRVMWEAVPEGDRGSVRDAAVALLAGWAAPDGSIRLRQAVRLTVAER